MLNKKLIATVTKSICGVLGASLVLENNHPYITLIILCMGAAANEYIIYAKN